MASTEECEKALQRLAAKLGGADGEHARRHVADRSVSCHLTDLEVTFTGHLRDGGLHDIAQLVDDGGRPAQIRLALTSDDLVALTQGELHLVSAWTSGRVKIEASILDLMKLRKLL